MQHGSDRLAYRESQTGALLERIQFLKPFEHLLLILLRDTAARVFHRHTDTAACQGVTHFHISMFRVLEGIGDKVGQHLLYTLWIRIDYARRIRYVDDQLCVLPLSKMGKRLVDSLIQSRQIKLLNMIFHRTRFHLREIKDVIDQCQQYLRVLIDIEYTLLLVLLCGGILQNIRESHD